MGFSTHYYTARLWALAFCMVAASTSSLAQVSYETVTFIGGDGHRYVNYATTRSDADTYTVFFNKAEDLQGYLYINPNEYQFDRSSQDANLLRFQQGSYALISQGDYINAQAPEESSVTISSKGVFKLSTWNGKMAQNEHFGIWNTPGDFSNFAAAWVLPDQYEIIEYSSNRQGEWVQRNNTLAFFGKNLNDITFEISYRPKTQAVYANLKQHLQGIDNIAVEQTQDSLTVILKNEILFASGSSILSEEGRNVIIDLARNLGTSKDYEVIVEGHTDDVPIRGELALRYPTNWELSSARALKVVHALSSAGIEPSLLQARAFGPFRPRITNNSEFNRKNNRRIELVIRPRNS